MRFLHTSDLHLRREHPERLEALDALLETARERDCRALVIAGDLFDSKAEALALADESRRRFDASGLEVVLIPGNHDAEAFPHLSSLGRRVRILREPGDRAAIEGVTFLGLPFQRGIGARGVLDRLPACPPPAVLVAHASFFTPEFASLAEDITDANEFPLYPDDLRGRPWPYAALGHYHAPSAHDIDGVRAVYPGTPCSISRRETGPRRAMQVEVDGGVRTEAVVLPTAYFVVHRFVAVDGMEDALRTRINEALSSLPDRHARAVVRVDAFVRDADALERDLAGAYGGRVHQLEVERQSLTVDSPVAAEFQRAVLEMAPADPDRDEIIFRAMTLGLRALAEKAR